MAIPRNTLVPPPPPTAVSPLQLAQLTQASPQIGGYSAPQTPTLDTGTSPSIGQAGGPQPAQMPPPLTDWDEDDTPPPALPSQAPPEKEERKLISDDPEIHQKMLDMYKKSLDAIGNGGATKEQQQANRALSLFGNIVAPAMAAFGKGGVSAAGVQLMNQAKQQYQQKQAEYKGTQDANVQVLKQLNDLSKIDNDAFHKQILDDAAENTQKWKQQNAADTLAFKKSIAHQKAVQKDREDQMRKVDEENKTRIKDLTEQRRQQQGDQSIEIKRDAQNDKHELLPGQKARLSAQAKNIDGKTSNQAAYLAVSQENAKNGTTKTNAGIANQKFNQDDKLHKEYNDQQAHEKLMQTLKPDPNYKPQSYEQFEGNRLPATDIAKKISGMSFDAKRNYLMNLPEAKRKEIIQAGRIGSDQQ